jgi:hypothetical protein
VKSSRPVPPWWDHAKLAARGFNLGQSIQGFISVGAHVPYVPCRLWRAASYIHVYVMAEGSAYVYATAPSELCGQQQAAV